MLLKVKGLTQHEAIGQVGSAGGRVTGGGRGVEPHSQHELEIEGNDVGHQAKDRQQRRVHSTQPDQSLVLYHLNHYLRHQTG